MMEKEIDTRKSRSPVASARTSTGRASTFTARSRRHLSVSTKSWRSRRNSIFSTTSTLTSQSTRPIALFGDPAPESVLGSPSSSLQWYHTWLHAKVPSIPATLRELRVGNDQLLGGNTFERVFKAVAEFAQSSDGASIDEVVSHLREALDMDKDDDLLDAQRLLCFAILGWQSMLYDVAFNVCPLDQIAIQIPEDVTNSGLVFENSRAPADVADRPLFVVLKAFGNLLPRSSTEQDHPTEASKAAASWLCLNPADINVHLLTTLLRLKIRWVDCLSLHLDYNRSTRTLSLFSYPSFCVAMLESRGPIFAFASTERNSFDPRANQEDIAQFMREVLLSYRLLFGQHALSRKLFPGTYKPEECPWEPDPLLPLLCMTKGSSKLSQWISLDQPIYFAPQHFRVLAGRVELVATELLKSRPTSIRDLLKDRRDKLQFWTFWLVSIVGGISVLLSLIQVILQSIQLAKG